MNLLAFGPKLAIVDKFKDLYFSADIDTFDKESV